MRPPYPNEHNYAILQEVQRHDDAVHYFGEMTALALLWNIDDFEASRVIRCTVCYTPFGDIADAYQQPSKNKCTNCYGTTFNGGLRALVYRPVIWAENVSTEEISKTGQITVVSGTAQTTSDIRMRDGDFLVRQDGTRWRITAPQDSEIATGFGAKGLDQSSGWFFRVQQEEKTSVAYTIPINAAAFTIEGWKPYVLSPTSYDVVNGPLTYGW